VDECKPLASDLILLAIIFNTFSNTFKTGFGVAPADVAGVRVIFVWRKDRNRDRTALRAIPV